MFTSLATALRNSIESMILIFQECCFGINISSVPLITIPRGRVPVLCRYHRLVQVSLSNGHMVLGYCSGVRINRKYPHSVHSSFTPKDLPRTDFLPGLLLMGSPITVSRGKGQRLLRPQPQWTLRAVSHPGEICKTELRAVRMIMLILKTRT